MMAVETFVYLYIIGFGLATIIAISLLVMAARKISRQEPDQPARGDSSRHAAGKSVESLSNDQ